MSIFAGLSSSTGLIAGGVVTVAAVAVAGFVLLNPGEKAPVIGGAPVQVDAPKIDVLATSTTPVITDAAKVIAVAIPPTDGTAPVVSSENLTSAQADPGGSSGLKIGTGDAQGVAASRVSNNIVARVEPGEDVALSTEASKKPEIGGVATGLGLATRLKFDLVRIDKHGSTVVAGKAAPGGLVEIYLNGDVIAEVRADAKGAFVALFDIPVSQEAQVMTLAMRNGSGDLLASSDRVLVMGREVVSTAPVAENAPSLPNDEAAPQVIIATDEGIKVLQPAAIAQGAPDVMANISLDLISYDSEGEVVLAGRSDPDKHVRIYVDDKPVKTESVSEDGSWSVKIPEVDAGQYTLRVDEIDDQGTVTSRIETPFQKENPEEVKKVASIGNLPEGQELAALPGIQQITIQPGATLWALAEAKYGQGDLYMQIFNANKDNIRDPDLIYPGQIFELPE